MEIWKDIPGYEGYQASNLGNIKSIDRIVNYGDRLCRRKGKLLKPNKSKVGYYTVAPKQKTITVHQLIALTFLGNREPGLVIDHINGDYLDNRAENLRYITQKGNVQNALRLNKILTGESCSWSKLKVFDVLQIRDDKRPHHKIASDYNISRQTVGEIKRFLIWKNI